MYQEEAYQVPTKLGNSLMLEKKRDITFAENIDRRIANMKEQIDSLERTKLLLQQPGGLLNVPMEDLRFAMQY